MELSNILKIIEIYLLASSIIVLASSIIISTCLIIRKIKKNRNLETIKYLSTFRKEIWELMGKNNLYKLAQAKNNKPTTHEISQKLEYLAVAVNNNVLDFGLVQKLCGRWFMGVVDLFSIMNNETKNDAYQEIKKLYEKLDKLYNK